MHLQIQISLSGLPLLQSMSFGMLCFCLSLTKGIFIFLVISSFTHWLFKRVPFNVHLAVTFAIFLRLLISSCIPLRSEKMFYKIGIFLKFIKTYCVAWGTWVVQWVRHLTLAQVMISRLVALNTTSHCVVTARSLESSSGSVCPSLSAPPRLTLCLSLSKK